MEKICKDKKYFFYGFLGALAAFLVVVFLFYKFGGIKHPDISSQERSVDSQKYILPDNMPPVHTWTGKKSVWWGDVNNWDTGVIPGGPVEIIMAPNAVNKVIQLDRNLTLKRLVIPKGGTVRLRGYKVRILEDLSNEGILEVELGQDITIGHGNDNDSGRVRYVGGGKYQGLPLGLQGYYDLEFTLASDANLKIDDDLFVADDLLLKNGGIDLGSSTVYLGNNFAQIGGRLMGRDLRIISDSGNISVGKTRADSLFLQAKTGHVWGNRNPEGYINVKKLTIKSAKTAGKPSLPLRIENNPFIEINANQGVCLGRRKDDVFDEQKQNIETKGQVLFNVY